jgi:mono/diheme cytochrome c family protein
MNALSACLLGREGGAVLPVPEETAPSKKAKSSNPPSGNGSVPSLSAAVGAGAAAAGKATEASGASSAGKAVEGAGANSAAASKAGSRSGSSAKDSNVAVLESLIQIKCSTCHGSGAFSFSAGDSLSSIKLSFTSKNKKGRTSGTISAEEILDALTTYPEMEKFAAKLTTSEKAALEAWKRN